MPADRDNVVILPVVARPRPLPEPANDNAWPADEDESVAYETDPFSDLFDDDYNDVDEGDFIEDGSNVYYPDFRNE